jgi:hypothetical protein
VVNAENIFIEASLYRLAAIHVASLLGAARISLVLSSDAFSGLA